MEFKEVIKNRYSCRKFSDRAVEPEKLTAILEAGRLAPTAKNLQEQHVYVLRSASALATLDTVTPCRFGAPVALVVAYHKDHVFTYPGGRKNSGDEDAAIVATQMILAATDEGLASCWLNHFDPDEVSKAFGLPDNEDVLMVMDIGYAAEDARPSGLHESRKELTETVSYI